MFNSGKKYTSINSKIIPSTQTEHLPFIFMSFSSPEKSKFRECDNIFSRKVFIFKTNFGYKNIKKTRGSLKHVLIFRKFSLVKEVRRFLESKTLFMECL